MNRHRVSNAAFYERAVHGLKKLEIDLEMLILSTNTGVVRERLTEANILMLEARTKLDQARQQFNKDMGLV